jgi:uncharacterized membrane protein
MHNIFQLFKIRGFGEYISDSFNFIKLHGKNYFKNFLKFAFIPLLLLMVSMAVLGTFYSRVFSTFVGFTGSETIDNNFITQNAIMLVIGIVVLVLVTLYLSLLNYTYPVYYLKLVADDNTIKPELKSIKQLFKNDFGRLLLFGLLSFLTFFIIGMIAMSIAVVLAFVLIGFLLLIFIAPFFITWYTLTLFYYIDKKQSFFDAFKNGFNTIINNFWPVVGASLCMLIIVYVLGSVITFIPYIITIFGFISGVNLDGNTDIMNSDSITTMTIVLVIVYALSILVNTLLGHLLLIQNGLVYYSEREKVEYTTMKQSIDEIGKYE